MISGGFLFLKDELLHVLALCQAVASCVGHAAFMEFAVLAGILFFCALFDKGVNENRNNNNDTDNNDSNTKSGTHRFYLHKSFFFNRERILFSSTSRVSIHAFAESVNNFVNYITQYFC